MVRRLSGRPVWLAPLALVAALVLASPAAAQQGIVKGVVNDDKGQPVEDAKVIIQMTGGTDRRFESKSNKKGEYIQIGLASGAYKVGKRDRTSRTASTNSGEVLIPLRQARPRSIRL